MTKQWSSTTCYAGCGCRRHSGSLFPSSRGTVGWPVDFHDIQFVRDVVRLRSPIPDRARGQLGLGREPEKEFSHELGLKLGHVGVEFSGGVPVPHDVEGQVSRDPRVLALCISQQAQEGLGRLIKTLVRTHEMVDDYCFVVLFFHSAALVARTRARF